MPSFRTGKVVRLLEERPGLQRVEVDLGDGPERAYTLLQLTGPVAVGDRVVVNTTAVELGLGTGGWHVVHWNLARDEWHERGPGHIIKGRYTSLQADVGSTEEHLESLAEVESIDGMPVVAAALHSQVPAVAAAFKDRAPGARLAYVMTDGAGLAAGDVGSRRGDVRAQPPRRAPSRAATRSAATSRPFRSTPPSRSRASSPTPTPRWWRWGRASSAPTRGSGSAAWRSARSSTPRTRSVESRSRACACRSPTSGRATTGCRTTPQPHSGSRRASGSWSRYRTSHDAEQAARLAADLHSAGIDDRHELVDVDAPDALELLARHHLRVQSMGRAGRGRSRAVPGRGRRRRARRVARRWLTASSDCSTSRRRCSTPVAR